MRILILISTLFTLLISAGCDTDASIASRNLSKAADMFEINRRIIFLNVMTNEYILSVEGRCAVVDSGGKVAITCKTGDGENQLKKHQMGRTETVTYFSEQLEWADVSVYHYKVIFKPQAIIPDVDFKGSIGG